MGAVASRQIDDFYPVIDRALLGVFRRQQELAWSGHLVEDIEVEELHAAGLPPAHVGVAAGPVVVQGGDYFGRTVNLAAPEGVAFVELGELRLEGLPVRCGCWRPAERNVSRWV
jgi:hypothetical protein